MRNHRSLFSGLLMAGAVASPVFVSGCNGDTLDMPDMAVAPDLAVVKHEPLGIDSAPCDDSKSVPLKGSRQMIISNLTIGDFNEGFDFTGDKKVDNKFAPVGAVANPEITKDFTSQRQIIVGIELFGYNGTDSSCTK